MTAVSLTTNYPENSSISGVFEFCKELNEFLTKIKIFHLFTDNYDSHKIYGELYDSLSDLFDSLQEEIIGLVRSGCSEPFPNIETHFTGVCYEESTYYNTFKSTIEMLFTFLTCNSFETFFENAPKHGINNILEEIYSAVNKAEYLLGMVFKNAPAPELNNLGAETQTDKPTDSPTQTFEILPTL